MRATFDLSPPDLPNGRRGLNEDQVRNANNCARESSSVVLCQDQRMNVQEPGCVSGVNRAANFRVHPRGLPLCRIEKSKAPCHDVKISSLRISASRSCHVRRNLRLKAAVCIALSSEVSRSKVRILRSLLSDLRLGEEEAFKALLRLHASGVRGIFSRGSSAVRVSAAVVLSVRKPDRHAAS